MRCWFWCVCLTALVGCGGAEAPPAMTGGVADQPSGGAQAASGAAAETGQGGTGASAGGPPAGARGGTAAGASGAGMHPSSAGSAADNGGAVAGANASAGTAAIAGAPAARAGAGGSDAVAGSGAARAPMGAAGTPAAGSGGMAGMAGASGACAGPASGSKGQNPLFTDEYTADPGVLVDGCTFYIHCGHDEGPNGFVLREWFVLASTDMVTWTKQVAMRVSDFAWADANAWAGQAVKKGAKYYWFVPVQERGGGMTIGVAVADAPTGPFRDAIGKPLINDAFEMSNAGFRTPSDTPFTIDPTVWIDDDGQAYLHYGGFSRMMVAKLSEDLMSIDGQLQEVTPRGFFEAPYLFKHDGTYYVVYAAGTNPATIDYATSDSPLGPWEYRGRILDALPAAPGEDAPTSHPAVAQFAEQWYLVYHLSNGPNGGGTYKRQVAIDKLTIQPDGTIPKITASAGLQF
jgi:Glycosyl hydrolases family 43